MAHKRMPTKLKVLAVLMSLSSITNLAQGKWIVAMVGAAMLVALLRGSDGIRTVLMGLAGLALVVIPVQMLMAFSALRSLGAVGIGFNYSVWLGGVGALGMASAGFMLWCLGQDDVQSWMFERTQRAMPE
ncbi:MAG: hypothetical protein HY901_29895 [Deltaproteobacteria bacterium]|nr:hypothetical protein [Deltaproteobacteria bacterium]